MNFAFTIKRVFKDAAFIAMLAGILIISFLAFKAGENVKTPPYGFVCGDENMTKDFIAAGFVECADEEELKREIAAAHLDCGVVADVDGAKLITSPETLLPELCRTQTVSVITAAYAPKVTYEALEPLVTYEEVKNTYDAMLAEEPLFSFEITTGAGKLVINDTRSRNLFKGALAIMVFIAAWLGCCRPAYRHACDMEKRFTRKRAIARVMLPEVIIRAAAIAMIAAVTCLIAGQNALLLASLKYTGIIVASGIIAVFILPDSWLLVLTVFITILSLGLCPMFTDLAEVIPALGAIRKGLLPYLMWVL